MITRSNPMYSRVNAVQIFRRDDGSLRIALIGESQQDDVVSIHIAGSTGLAIPLTFEDQPQHPVNESPE